MSHSKMKTGTGGPKQQKKQYRCSDFHVNHCYGEMTTEESKKKKKVPLKHTELGFEVKLIQCTNGET